MPFTTAAVVGGSAAAGGAAAATSFTTYATAAASLAGTAISAYSQFSKGQSQRGYGDYQQNMYNAEADRLLQQRELVDVNVKHDIHLFQKNYERQVRAPAFVARIKQGVDAGTGTPARVALASAREADEEIAWFKYNANKDKRGLADQAAMARYAGRLISSAAQRRARSSYMGAGLSLLAGDLQSSNILRP